MEMILALIAEIKWPLTIIIAILIIKHEMNRRKGGD